MGVGSERHSMVATKRRGALDMQLAVAAFSRLVWPYHVTNTYLVIGGVNYFQKIIEKKY
jgi:hypothetical protein